MKFLLCIAAVVAVAVANPPHGRYQTIQEDPAVVVEHQPIYVGPAVVDGFEPIQVGSSVVDGFEPIRVGPAIIDFPVPESAVNLTPVAPSKSPLVQIIVNVVPQGDVSDLSPLTIDRLTPVQVDEEEIIPTLVNVVEALDVNPEPVHIFHQPIVNPEPVINVAPAEVAPEILN